MSKIFLIKKILINKQSKIKYLYIYCTTNKKTRGIYFIAPCLAWRYRRAVGRDDWIRTSDHLHPMQMRYQAALHPEHQSII